MNKVEDKDLEEKLTLVALAKFAYSNDIRYAVAFVDSNGEDDIPYENDPDFEENAYPTYRPEEIFENEMW